MTESPLKLIEKIKLEFTPHAPKTEVQRENHEIVNAIFIDAAVKVAQICPRSEQLTKSIEYLQIAKMFANVALAVHNNAVEDATSTGTSGSTGATT